MALRVVHLEDDALDGELIAAVLRDEGIECRIDVVATREEFERALEQQPDLILSDFSMPGFDGRSAQALALARWKDVPFVFVSGSIGEERAVEALRNGATDYVLKDRLEKLPMAVRRAVREASERRGRVAAEAALRQLNAELEIRIDERTRALTESNAALMRARRDADRANKAKSDFLSRMSHELRTPLNAILGFAQLLDADPLTADQSESVGQILRGGQHLLNLINEVLDIARIEAGYLTISREPVSLREAVGEVAALVHPLAAQRGIRVNVDAEPCTVSADRQRLNQVLLNLTSNAVKYNRPGGSVTIRARRSGMRVSVAVADTGAGIPEDKLGLLFTPFERLGAETSSIEGTGLGLTLAKHLTEAMDGTLTVESVIDRGTTFEVLLPATDEAPSSATQDAPAVERPQVQGSVLYVEDNAANMQLMRRVLQRRPRARLECAPDGRSALAWLASSVPDLIILDLHLSDMKGEEVLAWIVEQPELRHVPVAVLSADATRTTQQRLLAAGAHRYITKPFEIAELLHLVDDMLGRAS